MGKAKKHTNVTTTIVNHVPTVLPTPPVIPSTTTTTNNNNNTNNSLSAALTTTTASSGGASLKRKSQVLSSGPMYNSTAPPVEMTDEIPALPASTSSVNNPLNISTNNSNKPTTLVPTSLVPSNNPSSLLNQNLNSSAINTNTNTSTSATDNYYYNKLRSSMSATSTTTGSTLGLSSLSGVRRLQPQTNSSTLSVNECNGNTTNPTGPPAKRSRLSIMPSQQSRSHSSSLLQNQNSNKNKKVFK